jgi:hypothetical protein
LARTTEDWCVIFLVVYVPFVVFAWTISPAAGLIATAVLLFVLFIGNSAWGPPPRRRSPK